MIAQILSRTPAWVFALFIALLYVGFLQTKTRRVTPRALLTVPAAMVALSLYGICAAVGASVVGTGAWLLGIALSLALNRVFMLGSGVTYHAGDDVYSIPGSAAPLVLMLAIFFTRYGITVALARMPSLVDTPIFVAGIGMTFGLLSGTLLARALRARSHKHAEC